MGFYRVSLDAFAPEPGSLPGGVEGLDAVDNWSVGYLREDGYHCMAQFARSRREPALKRALDAPVYAGDLALCVGDVTGRSFFYRLNAGS